VATHRADLAGADHPLFTTLRDSSDNAPLRHGFGFRKT
jgi:hypothetical protein